MRHWCLAAMCAIGFTAASGVADASVDGQVFGIIVESTVSGTFDGDLYFDSGVFYLDTDTDGRGTYTELGGGAISIVIAEGNDGQDYMGRFIAASFDFKQLGGPLGQLAISRGFTASITGLGFGNAGDLFFFAGTEILP